LLRMEVENEADVEPARLVLVHFANAL
jgi:hypothetical protein